MGDWLAKPEPPPPDPLLPTFLASPPGLEAEGVIFDPTLFDEPPPETEL